MQSAWTDQYSGKNIAAYLRQLNPFCESGD